MSLGCSLVIMASGSSLRKPEGMVQHLVKVPSGETKMLQDSIQRPSQCDQRKNPGCLQNCRSMRIRQFRGSG